MPALGGRKPSELMAAMLETCPRGEEKTNLFTCIFLQRLPWEIRVLLAKADTRTRRRWPHRRTSCGPSTTTAMAAAAWRLYRKIQTRILWPPSLETGGAAAVPPAGRPTAAGEAAAAKRPPGCRSRRLPRRPGWPPASASNTGDTARLPLLASSPAAGRETAVPGQLNAVVPGQLLHLTDSLTGRHFLVDTGASFSIFPHLSSDPGSGPAFRSPSGEAIPCWGEKKLAVEFAGRRFEWTFLLAKVNFAILGADFLKHFKSTC
jgi:hypothetical protein